MLQQKSIIQTYLVSIFEHSLINIEANNQISYYLDYAKTITDILLLENGSEELSTIYNKITTEPEEGVIYNNKEEFKNALRLTAVNNHF